jgi:hypothetical protein
MLGDAAERVKYSAAFVQTRIVPFGAIAPLRGIPSTKDALAVKVARYMIVLPK